MTQTVSLAMAGAVLAALLAGSAANAAAARAHSPGMVTLAGKTDENATVAVRSRIRTIRLADSHGYERFTLNYDAETVAIVGPGIRLSLSRRACNAHIIARFRQTMGRLIRGLVGKYSIALDGWGTVMAGLPIVVDGKIYVSHKASPIGRRFRHLPEAIIRMKWEEKFNCSGNEGSG